MPKLVNLRSTASPTPTVTPTPTPVKVTGLAADYALTIADLPSGFDLVPSGSGSDGEMYRVTFQNMQNARSLSGPFIVISVVALYDSTAQVKGKTSEGARGLLDELAVVGTIKSLAAKDFADEVAAFQFVPAGFSSEIPVIGYCYAFRRANVMAMIVALGVDTESAGMSAAVTIDDCEFFADRVLLKIERALR